MALAATRITLKHASLFDREAARTEEWILQNQDGPRVHFTEDVADSMEINAVRSGAVIISASGMCDGGRIRHHLRHNISRPECSIVFVGFQAAGTLGRRIVDGARSVRLSGEEHEVRARVFTIGGLSAHADRDALLGWLGKVSRPPGRCFVVHGEPQAASGLAEAIRTRLGWENISIPQRNQVIEPV
jgi:metallo-beta-lactamase family protein